MARRRDVERRSLAFRHRTQPFREARHRDRRHPLEHRQADRAVEVSRPPGRPPDVLLVEEEVGNADGKELHPRDVFEPDRCVALRHPGRLVETPELSEPLGDDFAVLGQNLSAGTASPPLDFPLVPRLDLIFDPGEALRVRERGRRRTADRGGFVADEVREAVLHRPARAVGRQMPVPIVQHAAELIDARERLLHQQQPVLVGQRIEAH